MKKFSGVIDIRKKHLAAAAVFLLGIIICIAGVIKSNATDNLEAAVNAGAESQVESDSESDTESSEEDTEDSYIKWVEFNVTEAAMQQAYNYDIETHGSERELHFIELLAYLGAKYGGDFSEYSSGDMDDVASKLLENDITMEELAKDMQYYSYYREAYGAVLDGLVGEYQVSAETVIEKDMDEENVNSEETDKENTDAGSTSDEEIQWVTKYGLKAYSPIAKGFPYSDYDDFGASRSYGYKRNHLGHDMMGQVGTPIIAVESGYVMELGWNQYGGWRIGISSFDGKRYYYYAHLRQNYPYAEGLEKGSVVQAGDVIGYMGRTGYSTEENVNNIDVYHLHFGLQLIFDESQRDGTNQIWVDVYPLVKFLYQNQSEVVRNDETKEWSRVAPIKDPAAEAYKQQREN